MFLPSFALLKSNFNKKKIVLQVLFIAILFCGNAQKFNTAALTQKLLAAKDDTSRVNIYYAASVSFRNKNTDSSILMAGKSLDLAQKIHFDKGSALAYLTMGIALASKEKFAEALSAHFKCLQLAETLGLKGLAGNTYNNIGIVYAGMNNFSKAIYYYRLSLDIALLYKDSIGYSTSALLINMGELYKENNQFDSAITHTKKGLEINRKALDSLGMAIALYNLSENYIKKKMFEKALPYLNESVTISHNINDKEGLAYCNNAFGLIYYKLDNYNFSMQYAQKGLELNKSLGIVEVSRLTYNLLYKNYVKVNDYQKALEYRNLEIALNNSFNNKETDKLIKNIVGNYELEKKQDSISILKKDKEIKRKELYTGKMRRNFLIAGFIILSLVAFFLYGSYSEKKLLNSQLEYQNKEILAQNEQLEELNEVKNKMFSIVSHDLRGPISAVKSMIDLIRDDMFSAAEIKTIIPKISYSLLQTSYLLDNLLYWAKSQMEGMKIYPKKFSLQEVIYRNIQLLQSRATEKKVSLQAEEIAEGVKVFADAAMIDIILRNLLENAMKFSLPEGKIIVKAQQEMDFVTVSVQDTGKGISPENQSRIFSKTESITTWGTAKEKGNGLGLLLCKELVEINKGKIGFTSKAGEGSTFYFTIPIATVENTVEVVDKT